MLQNITAISHNNLHRRISQKRTDVFIIIDGQSVIIVMKSALMYRVIKHVAKCPRSEMCRAEKARHEFTIEL